jgi:integrase
VHWQLGTVTVPRRHNGKGVKTRTLKLTDAGLAALQHVVDLECWGPFSNSSMLKSWHGACTAAGVPLSRVNDLRHLYATEMYRQMGDPKATAEMLMLRRPAG